MKKEVYVVPVYTDVKNKSVFKVIIGNYFFFYYFQKEVSHKTLIIKIQNNLIFIKK